MKRGLRDGFNRGSATLLEDDRLSVQDEEGDDDEEEDNYYRNDEDDALLDHHDSHRKEIRDRKVRETSRSVSGNLVILVVRLSVAGWLAGLPTSRP